MYAELAINRSCLYCSFACIHSYQWNTWNWRKLSNVMILRHDLEVMRSVFFLGFLCGLMDISLPRIMASFERVSRIQSKNICVGLLRLCNSSMTQSSSITSDANCYLCSTSAVHTWLLIYSLSLLSFSLTVIYKWI